MEGSITFFSNLSPDIRWGHSGYWLAVNGKQIIARDKDVRKLLDRIRSRSDRDTIFVEFLP